jgi:hypothetical protein
MKRILSILSLVAVGACATPAAAETAIVVDEIEVNVSVTICRSQNCN